MKTELDTAINAAQIGYAVSDLGGPCSMDNMGCIVKASQALAVIESQPGFEWGEMNALWDDVCYEAAKVIVGTNPKSIDWAKSYNMDWVKWFKKRIYGDKEPA